MVFLSLEMRSKISRHEYSRIKASHSAAAKIGSRTELLQNFFFAQTRGREVFYGSSVELLKHEDSGRDAGEVAQEFHGTSLLCAHPVRKTREVL